MSRIRYTDLLLWGDAFSDAVWNLSNGRPSGEVRIATLGLSAALQGRIERWLEPLTAAGAAASAGTGDGESSNEENTEFIAEGFEIAAALQRELGPGIKVHYFRNADTPHLPTPPRRKDAHYLSAEVRYTDLLLQGDAYSEPVWNLSEGLMDAGVDIGELGVSTALQDRIERWLEPLIADGAAIAAGAWDGKSRGEEERNEFIAEGFAITGALQRELGPDIKVHYFRNSLSPELPTPRRTKGPH